jgi:2-haloacid dehalogenase
MTTLAFDVYGTLIDTHGVIDALQEFVGPQAAAFSQTWRDKQLEYSFRRGLMQNYATFPVCTSEALDYTCASFNATLTSKEKQKLLGVYRLLPAFPNVEPGLTELAVANHRLYAFSNGTANAVETLLKTAGIREAFVDIVSVDELEPFKPNPAVHANFLRRAGTTSSDSWMISGNPFDAIRAISVDMKAAWIKRSPEMIFDPRGIEPTITVENIAELAGRITE